LAEIRFRKKVHWAWASVLKIGTFNIAAIHTGRLTLPA